MPRVKANQVPIVESPLDSVRKRFPCRDELIDQLEQRLTTIRWPFVLIDGPHSTGKTSLTRSLLETLNFPFSWTNCLEVASVKSLQSKILYDIDCKDNPSGLKERVKSKVTSNESFISGLVESLENLTAKNSSKMKVVRTSKTPTKSASKRTRSEANVSFAIVPKSYRYFIVLDNYEKLIDTNIAILPTLSQVNDMMGEKVHLITIMITTLYHDCLMGNFSGIPKPIVFTFPAFDSKALPIVVTRSATEEVDETYLNYSETVCSTLSASIGDLKKLAFISQNSFMEQIENLQDEGSKEEAIQKQLRIFFLDNAEKFANSAISLGGLSMVDSSSTLKELPKSTKYLLIAAFLASYNSKASDKKFFVILSDKNKKVSRSSSRRHEQTATAPKLFPLERLLHIYESLIYLNESGNHNLKETLLNQPTNQLLSQIETLVSLKLLNRANSVTISPLSSLIKYQISDFISYEFINSIAKSLDFTLSEHLDLKQN